MTLNLTYFYPALQPCSYVVYKIIISVLFVFISFHVYAINSVPISLKMFYSAILNMTLTHVLILEISVVNKCAEAIYRFRLSNNVCYKQYVCLLYMKCLIFRNYIP